MKQFNGYKQCSHCNIIYPIIMFYKDKTTNDGLNYKCIDCKKEYDSKQKKIYYEKNRDYILEYKSNYYTKNKDKIFEYNHKPENKEKKSRYYKKYSNTKSGRKSIRKRNNRRNRNLSYIQLWNNPFPDDVDVEYHHINNLLVIPLPKKLHKMSVAGEYTDKHRKKCLQIIKDLYLLDVEKLLGE